jgi:hypothetical protein
VIPISGLEVGLSETDNRTRPFCPVNAIAFRLFRVLLGNASFGSAGRAAPGSIASVFANGLGATDQLSGFPATTFQGVSASFNGKLAPLFHLSAGSGQIDLIVPSELPEAGSVTVQLATPSGILLPSHHGSSRALVLLDSRSFQPEPVECDCTV